jgi:hypothetical protein
VSFHAEAFIDETLRQGGYPDVVLVGAGLESLVERLV